MSEPARVELTVLGQTLTVRTEASEDYIRSLAKYLEERVATIKRGGVRDAHTALTLAALPRTSVRYEALPRFPAVQRDMAFVVDADRQIAAVEVEAALRAEAGPLLRDVTLFDLFRFPDGRRSLAWRLTFQAADRTLTDEEVNAIHARVAAAITRRFHVVLRTT